MVRIWKLCLGLIVSLNGAYMETISGLIVSLNGAYMETMSGVDCFIEWCVYGNYSQICRFYLSERWRWCFNRQDKFNMKRFG